jgi:hypothetical protein
VAPNFTSLLQIIAPKKTNRKGGTSRTPTYSPSNAGGVITLPTFRDHLVDVFASRTADDSRTLMKTLFTHDTDVSATVNGYLTLANTDLNMLVRDIKGEIDRDATRELTSAFKRITTPTDYTLGFTLKRSLDMHCEMMRHMGLLRGAIGIELVLDDKLQPSELRHVDMSEIEWVESKPGDYKPRQVPAGSNDKIDLNIPTFFFSAFRPDPTSIYGRSFFVSAINTIAARQQVINDLYRIMQITGFPRMDVKVIEEVLAKNIPANLKMDNESAKVWLRDRLTEVANNFSSLRADQAFIHFDSVEASILNEHNPGAGIDITSVIETLNAQNQAGLKTMSTIIGRGTSGVNTGSVEARIAAMYADELNQPLATILSQIGSFILHMSGYQGFCEAVFEPAELRPWTELEPQLTLKASRLKEDLSLGLITDDEYHLQMYNRPRPDATPELSGTGFMAKSDNPAPDPTANSDPLGRSLAPEGGKAAKGGAVNRPKKKPTTPQKVK